MDALCRLKGAEEELGAIYREMKAILNCCKDLEGAFFFRQRRRQKLELADDKGGGEESKMRWRRKRSWKERL